MRLGNARICIDCDEVYDMAAHKQCPRCGSRQTASLRGWLRPLKKIQAVVPVNRQKAEAVPAPAHAG